MAGSSDKHHHWWKYEYTKSTFTVVHTDAILYLKNHNTIIYNIIEDLKLHLLNFLKLKQSVSKSTAFSSLSFPSWYFIFFLLSMIVSMYHILLSSCNLAFCFSSHSTHCFLTVQIVCQTKCTLSLKKKYQLGWGQG